MKKKFILLLFPFFILSCAKIPVQSIDLADAIVEEGERMYQLNIALINKMFEEKREEIDAFIKNEYMPKYTENFIKLIPTETSIEAELSGILNAIVPEIITHRDSMQLILEQQRIILISKLDDNHTIYKDACGELKALLISAVNVNEARKSAFDKVKKLSDNQIDLSKLENILDNFIRNSGNIFENSINLNDSINSFSK